MFVFTVQWSEDEVGKKRIALDAEIAVSRYLNGERGKLEIDYLTDAFNDFSLVPEKYLKFAQGQKKFHGEIGEEYDSSRMLYIDEYQSNGSTKPIILLSRIDDIELSPSEFDFVIMIAVAIFAGLLAVFTIILILLSQSLIAPFNNLSAQLKRGNTDKFSVSKHAALEFTQLTEQLNHYNRELLSLVQRERAFSRYTSHELRTPLTVIKGANSLLLRQDTTAFQNKQLNLINESTEQMISIVEALLSLVQYERDKQSIAPRKVSEAEILKIIRDNFQEESDGLVSIHLKVTGAPRIKASSAVLSMVLGNLIRNARSACERGEILVEMDNDSISVKDTGSGLLDVPFTEGHGLGLTLVQDLCDRFNWTFTIKGHEGKGAIACIRFRQE